MRHTADNGQNRGLGQAVLRLTLFEKTGRFEQSIDLLHQVLHRTAVIDILVIQAEHTVVGYVGVERLQSSPKNGRDRFDQIVLDGFQRLEQWFAQLFLDLHDGAGGQPHPVFLAADGHGIKVFHHGAPFQVIN